MGGSSSTYKLPEELYETLICLECEAYLSCGPIKLLPSGRYLCGRCTFTKYVPQSLYEKIMENASFPCQYKKKGCNEYLLFNKVDEHETRCTYRSFRCPSWNNLSCTELVCLKEIKDHFTKNHPEHIIENDQFVIQLTETETQKNMLLFQNYDVIIVQYQYQCVKKRLLLEVSSVTAQPGKVLYYQLQFVNTENDCCYSAFSKKACSVFKTLIMDDVFPGVINMEPYLTIFQNPSNIIVKILCAEDRKLKMSWIVSNSLTWFQKFCINVLKCGPIPRHMAFIMDGNRRYAKKKHVEKRIAHTRGFDKLAETLQWCVELGIREVTMYAFSIENFNRSAEEVDTLMDLAREKFKRLMDEKDKLMADGVRIRVIGNLELLPSDIRKSIAEAMIMTKKNYKMFLNVAMAYTSRDDITNAIKVVNDGVHDGTLEIDDIDDQLLSFSMYTNHCQNLDVLVRTSGETRLSDFFLWESAFTNLYVTDVLWPEFTIWQLLAVVFKFQRNYQILSKDSYEYEVENMTLRKQKFLQKLELNRLSTLEGYKNLCI
ncbi:hypothetical protein FQR65_LT12066 [Abscondita terminalis]|nr:hypothetical protein FQR65_LT12066 [Abscondita terminalis]